MLSIKLALAAAAVGGRKAKKFLEHPTTLLCGFIVQAAVVGVWAGEAKQADEEHTAGLIRIAAQTAIVAAEVSAINKDRHPINDEDTFRARIWEAYNTIDIRVRFLEVSLARTPAK